MGRILIIIEYERGSKTLAWAVEQPTRSFGALFVE